MPRVIGSRKMGEQGIRKGKKGQPSRARSARSCNSLAHGPPGESKCYPLVEELPHADEATVKHENVRLLLVLSAVALSACGVEPPHSIVPIPRSFETGEGAFVLDASSAIGLTDPSDTEARQVVELWAGAVRVGTGLTLPFSADGALRFGVDGSGGPESYRLTVSESGVLIAAGDHAGLFYGLQTLSQLLPPGLGDGAGSVAASLEVRSVRIDDAPRFPYRGMHLDVARHFFGPDFVKRYIDMLARYKINRFHWHLTEDQG